jgi:hypothetical protein
MVSAEEIAVPIWSSILAIGFLLAVVCPVEKLNVLIQHEYNHLDLSRISLTLCLTH